MNVKPTSVDRQNPRDKLEHPLFNRVRKTQKQTNKNNRMGLTMFRLIRGLWKQLEYGHPKSDWYGHTFWWPSVAEFSTVKLDF